MATPEPNTSRCPQPPRCAHCGDVIGVYEPLVYALGDQAKLTSRAAKPELPIGAALYHEACYRSDPAHDPGGPG